MTNPDSITVEEIRPMEWLRSGNLLYVLEETGRFRRGEPEMQNRLTVRVEGGPDAPASEVESLATEILTLIRSRGRGEEEWRPIESASCRRGEYVLVFREDGEVFLVAHRGPGIGAPDPQDQDSWVGIVNYGYDKDKLRLTHWRPLPAAPAPADVEAVDAINDKGHPRFIAGYDAGLKDGRFEREDVEKRALKAEAELVAARAKSDALAIALKSCRTSIAGYHLRNDLDARRLVDEFFNELQRIDKTARSALTPPSEAQVPVDGPAANPSAAQGDPASSAVFSRSPAQVEGLREENKALRLIIKESVAALNNGGFVSEDSDLDFLQLVPKEIEAHIASLSSGVVEGEHG